MDIQIESKSNEGKKVIAFILMGQKNYIIRDSFNGGILYSTVKERARVYEDWMEAGRAALRVARSFRNQTMGVMPKIFTEDAIPQN